MKEKFIKALCFLKGHKPKLRVVEDWNEVKHKRFYAGVAFDCKKCQIQYDYISLSKYEFGI